MTADATAWPDGTSFVGRVLRQLTGTDFLIKILMRAEACRNRTSKHSRAGTGKATCFYSNWGSSTISNQRAAERTLEE